MFTVITTHQTPTTPPILVHMHAPTFSILPQSASLIPNQTHLLPLVVLTGCRDLHSVRIELHGTETDEAGCGNLLDVGVLGFVYAVGMADLV